MSGFTTGLSGLKSSQFALEVVSNNIANADTEGFHRRSVHQEASRPNQFGRFQIGTGVRIDYIERVRNQVTESSLTDSISDVSRVSQTLELERQIEALFQPGEGSLNQRIDVFFADLTKLTSTPGEVTQRGAVVEQANQLARVFHQVSDQLATLRLTVSYQIENEVDTLNSQVESLTELTSQIRVLEQTSTPNRELDQLDKLVNEIATVIDVTRNEHFASATSFGLGGTFFQLHEGSEVLEFQTVTNEEGELQVEFGDPAQPATFDGGRLPSLLDAYNSIIPEFQQKLDELAAGFIQQFDQVHATGVGPSGAFSLLDATRDVDDPTVPLNESGASFPIEAGELFISVEGPDGNRLIESISIDPATQSLDDVAAAISGLDHLFASVNPQTNRLQVIAEPGYAFDFAGGIETVPRLNRYNGTADPTFSGTYQDDTSQPLRYEVSASGTVGVSDDLFVNVFNEAGAQIARLDIGAGYEAGSELDVYEGVKIAFSGGMVINGDSFESQLVANPDETGLLSAVGLNSFFSGDDADSIQVSQQILDDQTRFASGSTSDVADTSNLFSMIELREARGMSNDTQSFGEYLNEVSTTIGIRVSTSTQLNSSLSGLQTKYEQDRDAISGVDLNEELVYLQEFQKQYEASVRVIQAVETMLEELFSILR